MIAVVDYGIGNLMSVENAFKYIGVETNITCDRDEILSSKGIILPGVGAFPDAMDNIRERNLDKVLNEASEKGIPILGICLGMQILFENGVEVRPCKGLGFLKGTVDKLKVDLKIPHMGWNSIDIKKKSPILEGVENGSYVYFVHSFYGNNVNEENLNASSQYGVEVPAVVSCENVFGIQFHPEKSGEVGLKILKNFANICS